MHRAWHCFLALALGLSGSLLGCKSSPPAGSLPADNFHSAAPGASQNPVAKAWNSTTDAVAGALKSKPKPPPDPTSLTTKAKISADTHIATGRLLESREQFAAAQIEYEKAAKLEPKNITALVSLARLQDRQGKPDEAIATYQKAIKADPKSALVQNDLGLCYARKRDLPSAIATLTKAVELEPTKPSYRNNLATVLVESNRAEEALKQLSAAHPPAAAHFNLAFLLNHRGQADLAKRHLQQALKLDPSMTPAQQMLAQLNGAAAPQMEAAQPPQMAAQPPAPVVPSDQVIAPEIGAEIAAEPQITAPRISQPAEIPEDVGQPVYHIGTEGIEEAESSDGLNLNQPTSHDAPTGAPVQTMGYHIPDDDYADVMVVTHLVYGHDSDPAPEPVALVDHLVTESEIEEPVRGLQKVMPVTELPTLYPVVE